jgi:hypothetical protein
MAFRPVSPREPPREEASAQITGATLTANPPPSSDVCPVEVSFTGHIAGEPGTAFWYKFAWHSGQVFSGDFVETMPASGSLPVQFSITVTDSTTDFMQLQVTHIAGNQPGVYSNAAYSVTCKFNPGARPPGPVLRKSVGLHPQWFALREYEYKTVGPFSAFLPERGTAPCQGLCIGWDHELDGAFLWIFHWNTFDRAFWGYDPAAIEGHKVAKATVTLAIASGDPTCFGALGRAVLTRTPALKGTTQTFHAPYPDDGDFNWPTPVQFGPGVVTIDATSIVQGWASGKMVNQGFVIRPRNENNGAEDNDNCFLNFGGDAILTIE